MTGRYQHPRKIWTFDAGDYEGRLWTDGPPDSEAKDVRQYRMVARDKPTVGGTIWLGPWCNSCEAGDGDPRSWCEDDVWGKCDWWKKDGAVCHCQSIRYDPVEER